MKKTWKQALSMVVCLVLLAGMMTVVPVGAASTLMYYPMETEAVLATSFYASHDGGSYTSSDGTTKKVDVNGIVDATVSYVTPGANNTAGAVSLTMVNDASLQETDTKQDGTAVTRGQDYRPRLITKDQLTLAPGNTYKVSYYIKASNLTGTNKVNLWLNTENKVSFEGDTSTAGAYRDVLQVTVTDEWQYVEKEFKVTAITGSSGNAVASATMTLGMRPLINFPSGTLYVDELKVELTEKAPAVNDVFESGIGDGTEEDPYELTTAADITKLGELMTTDPNSRSAHYKLMNDIDLSSLTGFQGLGTFDSYYFTGTFDGNGHIIKNMSINCQYSDTSINRPRGLFQATQNATIMNLGIENSSVNAFPSGIFAGHDEGSTYKNCYVRNSTVTVSNGNTSYGAAFVGGGFYNSDNTAPDTTFENCYSVNVDVPSDSGGFKGSRTWSTISNTVLINCYTTAAKFSSSGPDSNKMDNLSWTDNCVTSATTETATATALGSAFIENGTSYNSGLPVLAWEADRLPKIYEVTVTVGENGSVTKDGAAVPASFEVETGTSVTLDLVPDTNYTAKVQVNGADYTVTDNQVTLTVSEDTTVAVTFERIPDVVPGIASDASYSWFRNENGVPTIFTYHKLTAFNTGETDLEYGVKLWNTAYPDDVVSLAAHEAGTGEPTKAKAVPNAQFAIKAYGEAITAEQTYSVQPYVGEATGDTATPEYVQN